MNALSGRISPAGWLPQWHGGQTYNQVGEQTAIAAMRFPLRSDDFLASRHNALNCTLPYQSHA
ncbi:hypothetical protein HA62_16555 [Pseudomonas putida]|jgi:hypothetical protein|uniref:hypothetical protein n=1 Tax=Pseudomonas umsongensis TaxID=198618 RepID=UPI00034315AB|nr:hypothetical protein [Pseudomonas umsongensis]EPA93523.1 hypothetical protein PG5_59660 [Pseudomonas sp. G5(2012)]KEX92943.1 hypothetical protein HA62_16555 [Pseudomonas putida]